ncbi:MAG TPA: sulfur transferase domain-containing protein [Phycisphaerales bacterium]|nr:sulfur transferase domain-containing protein [Phycisphaerales bacterium]
MRSIAAISLLVLLAGCASRPHAPAVSPAAADPYPNVNSVAVDRDMWQQLIANHHKLRRSVTFTPTGVEATTESDDPAMIALIQQHAHAMHERMKVGAQVRVWDPVFADLFARYQSVSLTITDIPTGVTIVENATDNETTALLWSHAAGVSDFIRFGGKAGGAVTSRIAYSTTPPTAEVALGGVPHRFLKGQPTESEFASLKSRGNSCVVSFRPGSETPDMNESAAATSAGLAFTNLPFAKPEELTDALLDQTRATLRTASASQQSLALHCRSGNRVGAAWIAYRSLDQHVPLEQAVSEAKLLGLKNEALEARAREYVTARAR